MAISSRYTRGIEIQIGGNATKLKTALDSANRSIRTTQSELDTLKNSLKLEWDATKFQRAQALAQKALSETEAKAELLRKALLDPTEENVRIWAKCTRMTRDEMEDTVKESRELAEVFRTIADLMERLLPERGTL